MTYKKCHFRESNTTTLMVLISVFAFNQEFPVRISLLFSINIKQKKRLWVPNKFK